MAPSSGSTRKGPALKPSAKGRVWGLFLITYGKGETNVGVYRTVTVGGQDMTSESTPLDGSPIRGALVRGAFRVVQTLYHGRKVTAS